MTNEEIKQLAVNLTIDEFHTILSTMIEIRMPADLDTLVGHELDALADAMVALERVLYPLPHDAP